MSLRNMLVSAEIEARSAGAVQLDRTPGGCAAHRAMPDLQRELFQEVMLRETAAGTWIDVHAARWQATFTFYAVFRPADRSRSSTTSRASPLSVLW
ncbi:hypothetical protein ABZW96_25425 [Nocardia sp. NPDC004168]|uniref:hypothetical protein n=1 Tax=Nocardia TaxID=1817 RepID=UPI0033B3CE75